MSASIPSGSRWSLFNVSAAAGFLVLLHAGLTAAMGQPGSRAAVSDAIFALGLLGAGTLCASAAVTSDRRRTGTAAAWWLISAAMFTRAVAAGLSYFADPYRTPPLGMELVTGGLFLAAYAPLILGLFFLPLRRLSATERAGLGLDAAMTSICVGLFLAATLGLPRIAAAAGGWEKRALVIAMLALNAALIGVLAELLLIRAYRAVPAAVLVLLASCAVDIAADMVFVGRLVRGGYSAGGLVDTGWLAAAVLVAVAARVEAVRGGPEARPRRAPGRMYTPMLFQDLPMLFVVAVGGLLIWDHYRPVAVATDVLVWGVCAVGLLVLVRLGLSGYANLRLLLQTRASEEKFRLIAENASDVIWTRDLALGLTWISPSVARLRGVAPDRAVQTHLDDILTPDSARVARATLREMLARAEREGPEAVRTESITLEAELCRADGSTIWTETALRFLADDQGRPRAILGVTRDISRRRKAEAELREANAELQTRVDRRTEDLHTALERVRKLQGLLPICASCKRIRDEYGRWEPVDEYTARHGTLVFSHGLCPECLARDYPQ